MRDNLRAMPMPPRHSRAMEFLSELFFWACACFYGLVVGAVVAFVFVLLWTWVVG